MIDTGSPITPIAFFDSGYGGLTVLKEVIKVLPRYDYIYLGDNARAPYGDRDPETIFQYTKEGVAWLFEQGAVLVILACHTASAVALRRLQQEWLPGAFPDRKILGVLVPMAEEIARIATANEKIGIMGTAATIRSGALTREIEKRATQNPQIIDQDCPLLVPLIEQGINDQKQIDRLLSLYLPPLQQKKTTTLVLGCTHYPLLLEHIRQAMGERVHVVHAGPIVTRALKDYLARHPEIEGRISRNSDRRLHTTGDPQAFEEFAKSSTGLNLTTCDVVRLDLHSEQAL